MFRKISPRSCGFAIVSLLMLLGLYASPSQAQQPVICSTTIGQWSGAWDGAFHQYSCTGVVVETKRDTTATCPLLICVTIRDWIRARRQDVPGGLVVSAQAFEVPNLRCSLRPTSTAWTPWCLVQQVPGTNAAPPQGIQMIGISVAAP